MKLVKAIKDHFNETENFLVGHHIIDREDTANVIQEDIRNTLAELTLFMNKLLAQ